jgi:hypothetical protein
MREDRVGDGVIRTLAGVLTSLGLAIVLATVLCSGAAQAQSRIALVVGNSAYQHAPVLPTTLNDADDITQTLESLGFVTRKLVNASYDDTRRAIRAFNDLAPNAEVALIYFAGHGIAMNGENWIIPVDAELRTEFDVTTEAIGLNTLMQSAGSAGTLGIVILDACRDNPFVSTMARQTRSINRGLARVEPTQNVLVAYASKVGTTAEDGIGRNSPYTAALLKYLGAPGVDINLMLRKVRDDVRLHTNQKQQPFVYGSLPKRPIYLKEASVVIDKAAQSFCPNPAHTKPQKVPSDLVAAVAEAFQLDNAAGGSAVVRCVGPKLMGCYVGANLNCDMADTRRSLPGATAWCRDNPGSSGIPMAATGHATIYDWSCKGRQAVAGKAVMTVDSQGYVANNWKELR